MNTNRGILLCTYLMYINVHKQITQKANEDIWDVEFSHIIHIYSLF